MVLGCSISLSKELGGSGGKMTIFRRKNGNNGGDGNKAGGQSDASLLFSLRCEKGIFFPKKSWLCQRFGQQNHISCSPGAHRRCWRVCEQPLTRQLPQILISLLIINSALSLLLTAPSSQPFSLKHLGCMAVALPSFCLPGLPRRRRETALTARSRAGVRRGAGM